MTTLTPRTPLRTLAGILHAAAALGSDAWDGKGKPHSKSGTDPVSDLSADLLELFTLLRDRQIPHLLVGGVALLKYIEGRNTDDIDLIMSVESLEKMSELAIHERDKDFARGRFKSLRVDLLLTSNPLFREVNERFATTHQFSEIPVRCATVEGLVLLKLYALPGLYRLGQMQRVALYENDIAMLCLNHRPKIGPILEMLKPHLDEAQFAEVSKITSEIEQRVARMNRTGGTTKV